VVLSIARYAAFHTEQSIMISIATVTFVSERCPRLHDPASFGPVHIGLTNPPSGSSGNVLVEKIKPCQQSSIRHSG